MSRSRHNLWPLIVSAATVLATSCAPRTARQQEPQDPSNNQPQPIVEARPQHHILADGSSAPSSRGPRSSEGSHAPAVMAEAPRESPNPLHITLPSDATWVASPLPPFRPSRYRAWRSQGTIPVGKTHLQIGDVLDDGKMALVVSTMEGSVRVYDRKQRRLLGNYPLPGSGDALARMDVLAWPESSPARFVAATSDGILLYDATNGRRMRRLSPFVAWSLRWSPDGKLLTAVHSDLHSQTSTMKIFRRSGSGTLELLATIPFSKRVDGWDLSRDNRFLAATYYPGDEVSLIDLHRGAVAWRVPGPSYSSSVAISPDGSAVAVGGDSLVLIAADHPQARAQYTHFNNNIGNVVFSPSADAIVTSSYDGSVRIFSYDAQNPKLTLVKSLRHIGQSNVYALRFFERGSRLMSTGGDRTVRFWGGTTGGRSTGSASPRVWRAPFPRGARYPEIAPHIAAAAQTQQPPQQNERERRRMLQELYAAPRYRPSLLSQPPKPSRIAPGPYACRVSTGYKMRDCVVERDPAGHTMLEIESGNLIAARGVLFDDGPVVRFIGWLTDKRPFKCFACQERCFVRPDGCGCTPRSPERIRSCLQQPIQAVFRRTGAGWEGLLVERDHWDPNLGFQPIPSNFQKREENNRYVVELRRKRQNR